ncbi:hypothetical protein F4775DRAFT_562777 [Biscogniauxia sp. FL1348]|nr:hypothetical protein F4775DRAFT_562777 [Biscogniauxia sp. FL1348]
MSYHGEISRQIVRSVWRRGAHFLFFSFLSFPLYAPPPFRSHSRGREAAFHVMSCLQLVTSTSTGCLHFSFQFDCLPVCLMRQLHK